MPTIKCQCSLCCADVVTVCCDVTLQKRLIKKLLPWIVAFYVQVYTAPHVHCEASSTGKHKLIFEVLCLDLTEAVVKSCS